MSDDLRSRVQAAWEKVERHLRLGNPALAQYFAKEYVRLFAELEARG